ncbi:MAG: hypothetical protein U0930_00090 [Pirellulales bacterium]
MRLTLRTLLAYRDGVLSQADYEDLHRRIQQSPDAGNLLRRINELTASSNIPTPKVDATGLAGVNVIAEYLDDVLTSSRIAELERLCLEYSEHLCELAHCHQLIAQAMNTHVEVSNELYQKALAIIDPATREEARSQLLTQSRKMSKQIIAEVVEPVPSSGSNDQAALTGATSVTYSSVAVNVASPTSMSQPNAANTVPLATVVPVASSPQQAGLNLEGASLSTEVPEYLLGSRKLRWQIPASILGLTAMLVFLVWQSIGGSLDTVRNLMTADGSGKNGVAKGDGDKASEQPSDVAKDSLKAGSQKNSDDKANKEDHLGQVEDKVVDGSIDNGPASDKADSASNDSEITKGNTESATGDKQPSVAEKMPPIIDPNNLAGPSDGGATKPDQATDLSSQPSVQPNASSKIVWTPADEVEAQSVVLITTPDGSKLAEPGEELTEGRFLLPPVARTTIQAGSIKMLAVGPSVMVFNIDSNQLRLSSSNCRAIVSAKSDRAKFLIQTPCGSYGVEILDKTVWIGLEVSYRKVNKGSAVEAEAYAPTMILVVGVDAPADSAELVKIVKGENEQSITISSPAQGVAVIKNNQMETFALQSPPTWYRKRYIRAIDQLGLSDFGQALRSNNEPLADRIRALSSDNRPEVAALAIQTSMLRGDWQPFAEDLLSNDRMRAHWNSSLDLARHLIAGRPESQKELLAAFQPKLGADADRCAELVAGLSAANQNNESLLGLVKGLDGPIACPFELCPSTS